MLAGSYEYQVKAARYDASERVMSEASNVVLGTISTEINTINLTITKNESSAILTWNQLDLYPYYELYRSTNNGTYHLLSRVKAQIYENKLIKTNKTYTYKVRGCTLNQNEKIYSIFSNEVNVTI